VDILLAHYDLDEVVVLPAAAEAIHEAIGCPISLDSRNPAALSAALQVLWPHKCLINSVAAEEKAMQVLLPIAKEFGAAIVVMPTGGDQPLPMTVQGRLSNAALVIDAAAGLGIPRQDIVVDAICLASSAVPGSMDITLETLQALHQELGVATILGIGNAGFGMPEQLSIDLAFLLAAVPWGLDVALVDPATPHLLPSVQAIDFLTGRDPYGLAFIRRFRANQDVKREM
jgi:5-methyltetrahydrofolate--homocysteine methyltransferase